MIGVGLSAALQDDLHAWGNDLGIAHVRSTRARCKEDASGASPGCAGDWKAGSDDVVGEGVEGATLPSWTLHALSSNAAALKNRMTVDL